MKAADLVIWTDDPLELTNYPEQVYFRDFNARPADNVARPLSANRYRQAASVP
jgi:hypothetical protein